LYGNLADGVLNRLTLLCAGIQARIGRAHNGQQTNAVQNVGSDESALLLKEFPVHNFLTSVSRTDFGAYRVNG